MNELRKVLMTEKYWTSNLFSEKIFWKLITAYSESNRYYHNLNHIKQILDVIYEMRSQADNFIAIQIAAWFHDVIYNTKATDNEERSACYACTILKEAKISLNIVEKVEKLILITKHHHIDNEDIDCQIFLDADLSILGASSSKYQAYSKAIRQEYAWVSQQEYCLKRKQVLENFLKKEKIYLTEQLFYQLEKQARKNIQIELLNLSSLCASAPLG